MSGVNTKDSKINRLLARVAKLCDAEEAKVILEKAVLSQQEIIEAQQLTIQQLSNTNKLAAETVDRLDAQNSRLREYMGSVLFRRRQQEASCTCLPAWRESHRPKIPTLEPRWGNNADALPHKTAETV